MLGYTWANLQHFLEYVKPAIRENHGSTNGLENIIKSDSLVNYFDLGRNL